MRSNLGKTLLVAVLAAAPAAAQFSGYTVPGSLGEKRLSAKEQVMLAYQNARWQLGVLQLDPQLSITDVGYVSNVYSTAEARAVSDLKAQGGAGLRGFFNLGPKVLVSPFANLGYNWWQDQKDLRSSSESYGVQLFGDFNRLQLGLQGGRVDTQRPLSSELEIPVDVQTDRLQTDLDVDFWGPFRLFATVVDSRVRYSGRAAEEQLPGLNLSLLDVDSQLLKGGFAYELGNGLTVGLGWEDNESTFDNDPGGRSNRGSGPLLRLAYDGTRASLELEVSRRDLEFDGRESATKREQVIGFGLLGWNLTEKLSAGIYSATRLDASALNSAAIFESRRSGVSLQRRGSGRTRIGVFYEMGEDEFATVASDQVTRLDDFTSYGVNLTSQFSERLAIEVGFHDTRRDSSDPDFDRDVTAVTGRVRLGGNLLPW